MPYKDPDMQRRAVNDYWRRRYREDSEFRQHKRQRADADYHTFRSPAAKAADRLLMACAADLGYVPPPKRSFFLAEIGAAGGWGKGRRRR